MKSNPIISAVIINIVILIISIYLLIQGIYYSSLLLIPAGAFTRYLLDYGLNITKQNKRKL